MGRVIFVPVERLEQRYTGMVYDILAPLCDLTLESPKQPQIKKGQFLDICGTISYKSWQLNQIAYMFDHGDIIPGDTFLIGDIFFPGLESIRYMAELLGIRVNIVAFNHAGRADESDFVRNLGAWSDHSEQGWHDCCDAILVGSEYHRKRVTAYFKQPAHKVINTGMPWSAEWCNKLVPNKKIKKDSYIIWPHRLCFEKGVDVLYRYALTTSRRIVITSCGKKDMQWEQFAGMENVEYICNLDKTGYYKLLHAAEFYLSTARQETFGYTLQEAIHYGCKIIAPNAACYPEFLDLPHLYSSETAIDNMVDSMSAYYQAPQSVADNAQTIMDFVRNFN